MKHHIAMACLLVAAGSLSGCIRFTDDDSEPVAVKDEQQTAAPEASYLSPSTVMADREGQGETAVENALIWSEKYAEAVENLASTQQEKHELEEKNRQQLGQVLRLQQELKQCQQELADSNAMLIEMKGELASWKANVLGFRQEMQQAQAAQLIALGRVLKLLGGEAPGQDTDLATGGEQDREETQ